MKKLIPKLSILNLIRGLFSLSGLMLFSNNLFAQAPVISYSPSTNVYATGTAITSLSPANSGGAVLSTFGYGSATSLTPGSAGWNQPKGIAINASDDVYITNLGQFFIYKYDNSGNLLASISTNSLAVTGIVATSTGDLYALQQATGSIYKISGDVFSSTVITTISGVNANSNMAIDAANNIYITTSTGVSKYNITGNTTTTPITAGAHINGPSGVAVDAAGNIYVLNLTGGTLEKFNSAGVWQSTLVSGLSSPYGLAMDGSGDFFVGQTGSTTISSYTSTGAAFLSNISFGGYGLAIDSRGVLYASNDNVSANRYAPNGGYYINKTLPTGLSFANTNGIISGTPTVASASTAYKITGYNSSGSSSATVTISTATLAPSITYTPSTAVFQLNQVVNYTPVNTGSPATGYSISPATFPAGSGLSFNLSTGAITGTLGATFSATNYTVTATNSTGNGTANITLSCIFTAPSLSYSPSSYNYPVDVAITALNPANTGGVVSTWTITPVTTPLPAGLSFSTSTGAISGTPTTITSAANFNIKGTNSQGNSTATVTIAVVANPPVISYATPQSYLVNSAITTLNPTNTGGPVASWSISPALPTGLAFSTSTGAISGTPTVSAAAANYTVTAAGTSGSGNGTAIVNITCYKQFTWSGQSSTDWNTAGNWSGNVLPTAADQALIGTVNYTNAPIISANTAIGSMLIGTDTKALTLTVNAILTVSGDITYQSDGQSFRNFPVTFTGTGTIGANNLNIIANTTLAGDPYTQTVTSSVSNLNLSGNVSLTSTKPASDTFNSSFTFNGGTLTVGNINTSNAAGSTSIISIAPTSTLNLTGTNTFGGLSASGTNTLTVGSIPTINYTGNNNQTIYTSAAIANSLLTGGISYTNISFSGTTGIKTALGSNLNVSGSFTNSLTSNTTDTYLDLSAPTVNFNGAAQTLIGGGGTGTTFYNVTFSGSGTKTLSTGAFSVASTGVLTMGSGTTLATGGLLTLNSDASGAAGVAVIPSGVTITGNVNVQRFVTGGTGKRGYRLLSSPVYSGTANSNNVYSINYIANSSFITGTTPTTGGIDQAGNPTLYLFRENLTPSQTSFTSGNFRGVGDMFTGGITNIKYTIDVDGGPYNIPVGNGFLFFFRGDRSVATIANETVTSYVPTNTTFTAIGPLNTGSITVKDWFTPTSPDLSFTTVATPSPGNGGIRGYNLVGNPYPATINWEKYNRNSTNSSIYGSNSLPSIIYQFNSTSKQYATYTQNTSLLDTTSTVYTGALNSSDGVVSNMIASGQGFFIVANAATQSLTFHESAKTTAQATASNLGKVFAAAVPSTPVSDAAMRIKLVMDTINTDAVVLTLNSTNNAKYVYGEDAIDLGGDGALVNLSSLSADSVGLTVNKLPLPQTTALVSPLTVSASSSGKYSLKMDALENLPTLYGVWLKDNFMKDSLDMRANTIYAFDIDNTNPASYGANRFQVVIRQNPALGLHLLAFNAVKISTATQVNVSWAVENEANYTTFYVQRSTDNGQTFQSIGSLQSDGSGTYSFIDTSPVTAGQDQYRLQMSDVNNTITYSSVITIQYSDLSNNSLAGNISLYPNPAHDLINVSVTGTNGSAGPYTITITNSIGAVIKTAASSQPVWQNNVSDLLPGTYFVEVINNSNKAVVGTSKFIKL